MSWLTRIRQVDRTALIVAGVFAFLCLIDFSQRLWVPGTDANAVANELAAASNVKVSDVQVVDGLTAWMNQRREERQAAAGPEATDNASKQKPLLEGGVDLGPLRVRLRAILITSDSGKQVAIMEAQDNTERDVEFIERTLGETLGDYTVSAVRVNEIVFQHGDEIVTVPIFDYQRKVED